MKRFATFSQLWCHLGVLFSTLFAGSPGVEMSGYNTTATLILVAIGLFSPNVWSQTGGRSRPPATRPSRNTATTNANQPVFYTGKVVLDTGVAPPTPVAIIRNCNGVTRRETMSSSDGSFSFMVGADRYSDYAPESADDTHGFSADAQSSRSTMIATNQLNPQSPMTDCEIHAELQGHTSSMIRLDPTMVNSNVGVIMLHSRTKKADGMVTVASLEVPQKARKEYEKGSEFLEKGNLNEAEKSLHKAIDQYPKFAEAWTRLGDLEQRRKNIDAATKDYQEAINADPNLPVPYFRLAYLAAISRNWEDTCKLTERLIALDPTDFPIAYYYSAVAEFNLKQVGKAESYALRAQSMDKQHAEPRIELLLASIYVAKESYSVAADHYRAYLKLVPDGPLTEPVKTDLARVEQMAKSQAPAVPTPVQSNR